METIVTGLTSAVSSMEAERQWSQIFFGLDQDQRFVLLLVAIGCVTGVIIAAIRMTSSTIAGVHRRRTLAELKREMIDRGLSADEITRVIEAMPVENSAGGVAAWHESKAGCPGR